MSIRRLATLAAIAALGLLALGSASASASTTLRLDPGNTLFSGATTITNTTSGTAVLTTGVGSLTCENTKFHADIGAHSSPTTIPGTLTSLTFTSCTDTFPLVTVLSCHLHPASSNFPLITINGTGNVINLIDVTVRCPIQGGNQGCYYTAASANGTPNNPASTLTFTNVPVNNITTPTTDAVPTGACGGNGTFSVQLRHIVQAGTNRTVTILP